MRSTKTALLMVAALLAVASATATAMPGEASHRTQHATPFQQKYLHLYWQSVRQFGRRAPGRNIITRGVKTSAGAKRDPLRREIAKSIRQLRKLLHPVPRPTLLVRSAVPPAQPPAGVMTAGIAAGGCTGMDAESGSLGYNNNTHAGYIGCYQIAAGHFASGGSCAGLGTDPVGQDRCAAIICQTEGAGAWTNPRGQNPCGRLRR